MIHDAAILTLGPAACYLLIGHWLARRLARWTERGCVRLWEESSPGA